MFSRAGTAAAIFFVVVLLAGAGSASAAGFGTISGSVTNSSAAPLDGACVSVSGPNGVIGSASTDATGAYSIPNVPAGTYPVTASACLAGNYAPKTIPGVVVTANQITTVNASLVAGATITGTVTDTSANPLSGACVTASATSGPPGGGTATTNASGAYTITDLGAGTYRLVFTGCSAGSYQSTAATGVQTTAGQTTNENAVALAAGGTISGQVTDGSANPLAGVCVSANPTGPTAGGTGQTNGSGAYTIPGLAPGTYTLVFTACSAGNYAPDTITSVQVTVGQTTTENATLSTGATISGTVTDTSANPLAGACVAASNSSPSGLGGNAQTGANGTYMITGLAPGTYSVSFTGCAAGDYQPSTISGVQATAGQVTTENASLSAGGAISGHVTDATNNSLAGVCVSANPSGPSGQGGSAHTNGAGLYTIAGLASGTYTVTFTACTAGNFQPSTIAAVQVTVGQTTTENASLAIGAIISGTVTNGAAQHLGGVCVSATGSGPGAQTSSTTTNASGAYTINGLEADTYTLTFSACAAGNYGPQAISGVQATPGQTTTENATLPAGATITGTVTDTSGNPLTGACVSATPSSPGGQASSANTDAAGHYAITTLAADTYTVTIAGCAAGNYQSQTISGVQLSAGQTVTESAMLAPGGTLTGAVTDGSGNPIAGACPSLKPSAGSGTISASRTDSAGRYSFTGLAPGTYSLTLTACGAGNYASQTITGITVTVGQTTTENVTLPAGATIAGTITDGSGNPLTGICVTVSSSTPGQGGSATTDASGAYSVADLTAGSYGVSVSACGTGNYASQAITGVAATAGQTTTENFMLGVGATIAGTVTDSSGNPLDGICVVAVPSTTGVQGANTTTDASGAYSIPALTAGTYKVVFSDCHNGDFAQDTVVGVQAIAGQSTTENVALAPAGKIAGTVQDGSGNPVAGVCVSAVQGNQSFDVNTDSNGLYTIPGLLPGTYTLQVKACGAGNYAPQAVSGVQVAANATTTENFTLTAGGTVSGAVTDGSGNPLVGVCVSVRSATPGGQTANANTDSSGDYTISAITPGTYSVTFTGCLAGAYVQQTVTGAQVTAGNTTTENAALAPGGTIAGTVTDTSGNPIAGACVAAVPTTQNGSASAAVSANTDSSGHYTLPGVAPGSYTVQFAACSAGNYAPQTVPGVQVAVGQTVTENASLAPGGTISGTVKDTSGNPLSGVCVSALAPGPGAQSGGVNTDSAGNYTITDLAPGTYSVEFDGCTAGNYAGTTVPGIRVTAGQTTTENVSLAPGGSISGTVTDSSGNPLAGACVSADPTGPGGQNGATTTDSGGNYTISGLAAGSYSVEFDACDAGNFVSKTVAGVQVTAGNTTIENAALVAGGTIAGQVTDSSGRALAGACVTVNTPDGHTGTINTDANGDYSLPDVPPGSYTFTFSGCSAGNFLSQTLPAVQVNPGQSITLNVTLVQPGTITGKILNTAGNGVAGACVSASPSGSATTNAKGVYTITGLAPGTYSVTITGCSAGTYFPQTISGVQVVAGQGTTVNATLVPPGTIAGKIVNSYGNPVVGACVSAGPAGNTTTDASGLYTITGLTAGTYTLSITGCSAGSYFPKSISGVAVAAGKTTTESVTIVQPGTITGKILNTYGNGVAGACVTGSPSGSTTTNAKGVYTITGLTAGTYTLTITGCSAGAYFPQTIASVTVAAGQVTTENLTIVQPGTITGKITNTAGNPVAGACVSVSPSASTTTNASGVYTITGLVAGTYTLTIQGCNAGSYFPKTISGIAVGAGKTTTENLTLVQPGTITGKILNTYGNGVAGACVTGSPSGTATTNAKGVYTITGLAPGTYKLTITGCAAGRYFPQTIGGVAVVAGQTTTKNLTIVQPGTITGQIVNSYGNAVPGACVSGSPSGSTTTNTKGRYTLSGLVPGAYTLTIRGCSAGDYFTKTVTGVQVGAGKTITENLTIVQPGTITGKILNTYGNGVAGACVTGSPSGTATTNAKGAFTITGLTAGSYTLTITGCAAGPYFSKTVTGIQVGAGKTTTESLTLVQPGTITGTITNAAGKALAGACVSPSPSGAGTTTNASGIYTITGLTAGTYTLTIKGCTAGSYATKTITGVPVAAGKTATENATLASIPT